MKKVKEILKTKKGIIGLAILLILIVVIVIGFILNKDDEKDDEVTKELKENTYTMYVKINPSVKIEFRETYYVCVENSVQKACSDKTNEVTDYVLVNDDAKEIYGDIDMKGLSLIDALVKIYDTARDKKIDFDVVEITANYEFDSESLKNEIASESKYKVSFNVVTTYDKELNEDEIIDNDEDNKYYTVTFDSNGGSKVDSVKVKSGYGFTKPKEPTRSGYKFVEWQLDGKKYDFKDEVVKDITLKAKWEKVEEDTKKEESSTTNKPTENNNQNETNNNASSNNNAANSNSQTNTNTNTNTNANKINLNDNVEVTIRHEDTVMASCFFFMFATNLKEVFPNADIKQGTNFSYVTYWVGNENETAAGEIAEEGLQKNLNSLKFDSNKENELVNLFKKYQNSKYKGIKNLKYSLENHRFSFSYDYLDFKNNTSLSDGETANTAIKNVLKSATKFNGPCGGIDEVTNTTLTEELCKEYNLNCGRW